MRYFSSYKIYGDLTPVITGFDIFWKMWIFSFSFTETVIIVSIEGNWIQNSTGHLIEK